MAASTIEWTDATWNPVAGCTVVSPGCANCYAIRMAARLAAMGQAKYRGLTQPAADGPAWTGKVVCDEASLDIPLRWRKPRFVFVNSMSDLFHAEVPEPFIRRVWNTMAAAPQHTFQILTKRPRRMRAMAERLDRLPNVWLGTSVESSGHLWRIRELQATRAAVRFVSFEPLLGPVNDAQLAGVHWAIVGGESPRRPTDGVGLGPLHPRPMRRTERRLLLQTMGRKAQEAGGARTRRPDVERHTASAPFPHGPSTVRSDTDAIAMSFRWHPHEPPPRIEGHSRAKLKVLRSYLRAYFDRLAAHLPRDEFKLDLVDGFAGGGTFLDDKRILSGTPLIMLEESESARQRG